MKKDLKRAMILAAVSPLWFGFLFGILGPYLVSAQSDMLVFFGMAGSWTLCLVSGWIFGFNCLYPLYSHYFGKDLK